MSAPSHPWFRADQAPFPRPERPPAGKRLVVLAAHPDDDVLGCGGTLAAAALANASTFAAVLYLTDGEKGKPDPDLGEEEIRARRREEARRALVVLGATRHEWAGFPDTQLEAGSAEVEAVRRFLAAHRPDVLLVPAPFDPHPDHRATAHAAALALAKTNPLPAAIWLYEVQPCFPVDAIVRIDDTIEIKERALAAHESQNDDGRLVRAGLGMAASRALYAPAGWGAAEGFRTCSPAVFTTYCAAAGWKIG